MNGPLLNGPARDLILGYLQKNISNEFTLKDNFRSDGVNVQPIPQSSFYISEVFGTLQPPACYVLTGLMKFNYQGAPNWLEAETEFKVIVSSEDVGADVLQKQAESYGRILFKLLDQIDLATPDNRLRVHLVIDTLDYSDIIARKLGKEDVIYRRDVELKIKALQFEARTT